MAEDFAIKIENLKKQYRLGAIGGGTLTGDLQSWWARKRGKEDPNLKIGQDYSNSGERFLALDGINITIKKGEAVGIIGANGAGKSTLLKYLIRELETDKGTIFIDGKETEDFFNKKIQIIQSNSKAKNIIFEDIRPYLLDNFLIPELVDDWITYRDCNGDSIYALMDKKTRLQRLETYSRGGDPVYEFARFYRKFMEDKIQKQDVLKQKMQDTALKSLTDALVQQQLEQGINPSEILNNLLSGDVLTPQIETNKPLLFKKK